MIHAVCYQVSTTPVELAACLIESMSRRWRSTSAKVRRTVKGTKQVIQHTQIGHFSYMKSSILTISPPPPWKECMSGMYGVPNTWRMWEYSVTSCQEGKNVNVGVLLRQAWIAAFFYMLLVPRTVPPPFHAMGWKRNMITSVYSKCIPVCLLIVFVCICMFILPMHIWDCQTSTVE